MKIKNIAFSGFAAAILAGVSATDASAAINLVTQEYVTAEMDKKQNTLTAGDGIKIDGDTISAEVDLTNTIGSLTDAEGNAITVEQALAEKQDALTTEQTTALETIAGNENLETVLNSGVSSDTVQQVADNATAIESLETTVAAKANAEDVYTKTESDERFLIMQDANALGANLQWDENGKLNTKGIATAAGLEELENKVADAVTESELEQKGYQTADQVSSTVNTAITNLDLANTYDAKGAADAALEAAKTYADENDADTIYDDSALAARVTANEEAIATNTSAIKTINDANYISGNGDAGSYLVTKDGDGGVSWTAINVIDKDGSVMTLQ